VHLELAHFAYTDERRWSHDYWERLNRVESHSNVPTITVDTHEPVVSFDGVTLGIYTG